MKDPEYLTLQEVYRQHKEAFSATLSGEQAAALRELLEDFHQLNGYLRKEDFKAGVRLGGQMAYEIFEKK